MIVPLPHSVKVHDADKERHLVYTKQHKKKKGNGSGQGLPKMGTHQQLLYVRHARWINKLYYYYYTEWSLETL